MLRNVNDDDFRFPSGVRPLSAEFIDLVARDLGRRFHAALRGRRVAGPEDRAHASGFVFLTCLPALAREDEGGITPLEFAAAVSMRSETAYRSVLTEAYCAQAEVSRESLRRIADEFANGDATAEQLAAFHLTAIVFRSMGRQGTYRDPAWSAV